MKEEVKRVLAEESQRLLHSDHKKQPNSVNELYDMNKTAFNSLRHSNMNPSPLQGS